MTLQMSEEHLLLVILLNYRPRCRPDTGTVMVLVFPTYYVVKYGPGCTIRDARCLESPRRRRRTDGRVASLPQPDSRPRR